MMGKLNNKFIKTSMHIFCMLVFSIGLKAQSNNHLFNDYWKVGAGVNRDIRFIDNHENSIDYNIENIKYFDFGLIWNAYQWNNNNLKLQLRYSLFPFKVSDSFDLKPEDAYLGISQKTVVSTTYNEVKLVPMYEYILPIKGNYMTFGVGAQISYMLTRGSVMSDTLYLSSPNNPDIIGFESGASINNKFLYGVIGRVGFVLPTKAGAFDIGVSGHYGFNDYFEAEVQTFNLLVSPDTYSTHDATNAFVGLGLVYYPKRKNKKKD